MTIQENQLAINNNTTSAKVISPSSRAMWTEKIKANITPNI